MKTDFMIIGAMKCGTSTVANILRKHPDISFSIPKEPDFFSTTNDWKQDLPKYESYFKKQGDYLYGEGSTSYAKYPNFKHNIWKDLHNYNPDLRFIYLIRNPIDQITSSYMHIYERGFTDLSINDIIQQKHKILNVAKYHSQILPFIDTFGTGRVLILNFESLISDRTNTFTSIFEFLELEPKLDILEASKAAHSNKSLSGSRKIHYKYDNPTGLLRFVKRRLPPLWNLITDNSKRGFSKKPQLDNTSRTMLSELLNPEINGIANVSGFNLDHWTIR